MASWWLWLVAVAVTGGAVAFVVVQLADLRDASPAVAQAAALRP